jgi:hypothetical protein
MAAIALWVSLPQDRTDAFHAKIRTDFSALRYIADLHIADRQNVDHQNVGLQIAAC